MAPGLGRLKPDTTGSNHRAARPPTLLFPSLYIPSLGVKVQSDALKDNSPPIRLAGGFNPLKPFI